MSYQEKRRAYHRGKYTCKVPPSYEEATKWTTREWVEWIDLNGVWMV